MNVTKYAAILICFFFTSSFLNAQSADSTHLHDDDHNHASHIDDHNTDLNTDLNTHHHTDHHRHEIGVGNVPVYSINEKEISYGLHLHYTYNIPTTKFGLGLGYERVFDEHRHNSLGVIFSYRPIEKINFSLVPGIAFEDNELDHSAFALHFETAYEFEIKDFHLGPIFEVALDKHDVHLSLGFHVGIGF